MADWGGLMIGVDSKEPYTPPLEMVNVPPAMSSMLMVPSRAFFPKELIVCGTRVVLLSARNVPGIPPYHNEQGMKQLTV